MRGAKNNGNGHGKGDREEKTASKSNIIIAATTIGDNCLKLWGNLGKL